MVLLQGRKLFTVVHVKMSAIDSLSVCAPVWALSGDEFLFGTCSHFLHFLTNEFSLITVMGCKV